MEIETTIAPAGFQLNHPELHHYTSLAGMEGILRSRTMWATHFQSLNDSSEITHLQVRLTDALAVALVPIVNRLRGIDRRVLGESRQAGGTSRYARRHAETLVNSFYQAAFTGETVPPMAVPFITSFCSHAADQPYERENGLLSQWRGYGADGGCCIVFDTAGLISLLQREWDGFYWVSNGIDDVTYATDDICVASRYAILVDELSKIVAGGIRGGAHEAPITPAAMVTFFDAATRFKHQGFKEEREVRIVAIPGSADTADKAVREHAEFPHMPIKDVRITSENRGRPYLVLFDKLDIPWPIKRIIVGPSRSQDESLRRVALAVGNEFPLLRSETPFLG
jgi:hypothetical protein